MAILVLPTGQDPQCTLHLAHLLQMDQPPCRRHPCAAPEARRGGGPQAQRAERELPTRPADHLLQELLIQVQTLGYPFATQHAGNSLPAFPAPSAINSPPLLDAMVRETLRLYPPVSQMLPQVATRTDEGISLDGYGHIPSGERVGCSAYSLRYIKDIYPKVEEWLPSVTRLEDKMNANSKVL